MLLFLGLLSIIASAFFGGYAASLFIGIQILEWTAAPSAPMAVFFSILFGLLGLWVSVGALMASIADKQRIKS